MIARCKQENSVQRLARSRGPVECNRSAAKHCRGDSVARARTARTDRSRTRSGVPSRGNPQVPCCRRSALLGLVRVHQCPTRCAPQAGAHGPASPACTAGAALPLRGAATHAHSPAVTRPHPPSGGAWPAAQVRHTSPRVTSRAGLSASQRTRRLVPRCCPFKP